MKFELKEPKFILNEGYILNERFRLVEDSDMTADLKAAVNNLVSKVTALQNENTVNKYTEANVSLNTEYKSKLDLLNTNNRADRQTYIKTLTEYINNIVTDITDRFNKFNEDENKQTVADSLNNFVIKFNQIKQDLQELTKVNKKNNPTKINDALVTVKADFDSIQLLYIDALNKLEKKVNVADLLEKSNNLKTIVNRILTLHINKNTASDKDAKITKSFTDLTSAINNITTALPDTITGIDEASIAAAQQTIDTLSTRILSNDSTKGLYVYCQKVLDFEQAQVNKQASDKAQEDAKAKDQEKQEKDKQAMKAANNQVFAADNFLSEWKSLPKDNITEVNKFWDKYYKIWADTWKLNADSTDNTGAALLKRLDRAFQQEILAYGSNVNSNPFIKYLLLYIKNNKTEKSTIRTNSYLALHNLIADNNALLSTDDLNGTGAFKLLNVIFSKNFLNRPSTDIAELLRQQRLIENMRSLRTVSINGENVDLNVVYLKDNSKHHELLYAVFSSNGELARTRQDAEALLKNAAASAVIKDNPTLGTIKDTEVIKQAIRDIAGEVDSAKDKLKLPNNNDVKESKWFKNITATDYKKYQLYLIYKCNNTDIADRLIQQNKLSGINLSGKEMTYLNSHDINKYDWTDKNIENTVQLINDTFNKSDTK